MTLLCGTDFSEPSAKAFRASVALARRLGKPVTVAHIIDDRGTQLFDLAPRVPTFRDAIAEAAQRKLSEWVASVHKGSAQVEPRVGHGIPDEGLVRLGRELEARLIVVGTQGRRAPVRWLFGSVSERLMISAGRPVLVVPPRAAEGALFAAEGPLCVAVPVDVRGSVAPALDWLRNLPAGMAREVLLVVPVPRGLYDDRAFGDTMRAELLAEARGLRDSGNVSVRIFPVGEMGGGGALARAVTEIEPDLVALAGLRPHSAFWGGFVHTIEQGDAVPFVVFPTPEHVHEQNSVSESEVHLRKILAPTDFSETGNRAIPHAYELAGGQGGTVFLFHVWEPYTGDASQKARDRAELGPKLRALAPAKRAGSKISTEVVIIEHPHPAEALLSEARRLGVDAICMGSAGRSGMARAVMGSVTAQVLASSERPVFVIPARDRDKS